MKKLSLFFLCAVCVMGVAAQEQQPRAAKKVLPPIPSTILSVSAFTDYFSKIQTPPTPNTDMNAFDLRRADLGVEHLFSRTVSAVMQIEAGDENAPAGSTTTLAMKLAYVEVKNILPQMRVVMGLSPTPAVVTSERIWGYRALQMLPLEKYGMAPSVDNGLAMKGKIDPDGIVAYHVMVGNGTGTVSENDKIKRLYGSLGLTPMKGFTLEGYVDFENAGNDRYRATCKGLIGLEDSGYAFGLEGIYRINHHTVTQWYIQSPYAVSVYGWGQAAEKLRIVYRADYFDEDINKINGGFRTIEGTLGIDYLPVPEVHLIPNIIYASYSNKDSSVPKLNDGITLRLTAAFSFSSQK